METFRAIKRVIKGKQTLEGAGVRLYRSIGFDNPYEADPFLLFDDFRSDTERDYIKGFPWHPHRGIETITYVLKGSVEHQDSLGNKGSIGEGDIQWMSAGSGIFHQEMPSGDAEGKMYGFQLWANVSKNLKMAVPRYRSILSAEIPEIQKENGVLIRVIAGTYNKVTGPVKEVAIQPEYFDISLPGSIEFVQGTKKNTRVLFYIFEGSGKINNTLVENKDMVLFEDGDAIKISSGKEGMRFLMLSGEPINEPIAWAGPIVMNTDEELQTAYDELDRGTFIKSKQVKID